MPWELRAIPSDGTSSLGSVESVQAKLSAAVPGIEWGRDAGGSEKLAAMEAQGIAVPDAIRDHWLRSRGAYQGLYEGNDFTIEFHLGEDEQNVASVGIDVRGTGNPMSVVQRLTRVEGWKVVDLRGNPPTTKSWNSFTTWRDDSIRRIEDEGE